jgi:cytochrome P450
VARESCEIAGVAIKKDMPVFLALASGNRDPSAFERADEFDTTRDFARVMSFGQGRHRCIGEPLAMLQLTQIMKALVAAKLRPASASICYQPRVGHRWPERLILKKA